MENEFILKGVRLMKRLLLTIFIVFYLFIIPIYANGEIKVNLNEKEIVFDVEPRIIEGRTMVPMRNIFEQLGCQVEWFADKAMIQVYSSYPTIELYISNKKAFIGSDEKVLDVPPLIVNGRTLVPLRFIAEALYKNVSYDEKSRTVDITDRVADGWYIDTLNRFKIKMINNMNFEGCLPVSCLDKQVSAAVFTCLEDLTKPVSAAVTAYCVTIENNKNNDETILQFYNKYISMPNIVQIEKNKNFFLVSYNDNAEFWKDENRKVFAFLRQEDNTIYISEFSAAEQYVNKYYSEIIESIKSIGKY